MMASLDRRRACALLLTTCLSGLPSAAGGQDAPAADSKPPSPRPHKIPRPSPEREFFSGFFAARRL